MLLTTGENYQPDEITMRLWNETYRNISVKDELQKMTAWCTANPNRRKTKQGINRFINAWLAKSNTSATPPQLPAAHQYYNPPKNGTITRSVGLAAIASARAILR